MKLALCCSSLHDYLSLPYFMNIRKKKITKECGFSVESIWNNFLSALKKYFLAEMVFLIT